MNKFKSAAIEILKQVRKPLPSKEIAKLAIETGVLKSTGKTPERTMNAQLNTDIKLKGDASRFIKISRSCFALNSQHTD